MWNAVLGLVKEIRKCENAGATIAAVSMSYICIDTMAYLSMPESQTEQTRQDFINWVNDYLRGHPDHPYQYSGTDVYAARCALLHSCGAEAKMHRNDPTVKKFGYHDGGRHAFDPKVSPNLVIIGTASFLHDVVIAVKSFRKACQDDEELRHRVESRLPSVTQYFHSLVLLAKEWIGNRPLEVKSGDASRPIIPTARPPKADFDLTLLVIVLSGSRDF